MTLKKVFFAKKFGRGSKAEDELVTFFIPFERPKCKKKKTGRERTIKTEERERGNVNRETSFRQREREQ